MAQHVIVRTRSNTANLKRHGCDFCFYQDKNYAISKEDSYLLTRYRAADAARVPLSVMSESANWMRHKMKVLFSALRVSRSCLEKELVPWVFQTMVFFVV